MDNINAVIMNEIDLTDKEPVIKMMNVTDLVHYSRNSKKHPKSQIDILKRSITQFGFRNPVIIDSKNEIIAGHGRVLAAKELSTASIPCIVVDDLTPEQIKAFRIMDNKSAEGSWDFDLLKLDFQDLKDINFDLSMTGFSFGEIQKAGVSMFAEDEQELIDVSAYQRIKDSTKVQRGDVYSLSGHRLMCGDSTSEADVSVLMAANKADLCFTDPPYGITIVNKNKVGISGKTGFVGTNGLVKAKEYQQVEGDDKPFNPEHLLKLECAMILWGANNYASKLPDNGHWLVWDKKCEKGADDNNFSDVELAWTNVPLKSCKIYRPLWSGLLREGNRREELKERVHPTQKPVGLNKQIILDYSKETENILDLYGGSGSTLIACEQTKRNCYMMEIDNTYCEIICQRWEKLTGKQRVKL